MPRSFTRAQIRTRARFHADMEGQDVGVLDARVNELLDMHKTNVYRALVKAGVPNYYGADAGFTTTAGVISYPLPSDFYVEVQVLRVLDTQRSVPLGSMEDHDRAFYIPPQGQYSVTLEYVPTPPIWAADSDTFDGIAGYEEIIAKLTAADMLSKESSKDEAATMRAESMRLLEDLRRTAKRSVGSRYVRDVENESQDPWFYLGTNNIHGYRIRGGNLELYQRRVVL